MFRATWRSKSVAVKELNYDSSADIGARERKMKRLLIEGEVVAKFVILCLFWF